MIYDIVYTSPYGESGKRVFKVISPDREEAKWWAEQCTLSGKEEILSIEPTGEVE